MQLKAGTRLISSVCSTEAVVVKAPDQDTAVTCGGAPMATSADAAASGQTVEQVAELPPAVSGGTLLGKRYVNEDESLELLCTKPGDGSLGIGDDLLSVKETKPLPASD